MSRLAVLMLVLLCQGCAVIPVPYSGSMTTYIDENRLAQIEVGKTTRAEVLEQFGQPGWTNVPNDRWLYQLRRGSSSGVSGCLLLPGMANADDIMCTRRGKERLHVLDLRFDSSNIVVMKKSVVAAKKCTDDSCTYSVGDVELESDRLVAQQGMEISGAPPLQDIKQGMCQLLVTRYTLHREFISLNLDSRGAQIVGIGGASYAALETEPGNHLLNISTTELNETERRSAEISFSCKSMQRIYVNQLPVPEGFAFEQLNEESAAERITLGARAPLLPPQEYLSE